MDPSPPYLPPFPTCNGGPRGELHLRLSLVRARANAVRFKWFGEPATEHVERKLLHGKEEMVRYVVASTCRELAEFLRQGYLDVEFIPSGEVVRVEVSKHFLNHVEEKGVACQRIQLGGKFGGVLVVSCCVLGIELLVPATATNITATTTVEPYAATIPDENEQSSPPTLQSLKHRVIRLRELVEAAIPINYVPPTERKEL